MKKVVLFGMEYYIKYSIRQFFVFEELTGRRFSSKTFLDDYMLFYCNLVANNESFNLDVKQFLDAIDLDVSLYAEFTEMMLQWTRVHCQFKEDVEKKKI